MMTESIAVDDPGRRRGLKTRAFDDIGQFGCVDRLAQMGKHLTRLAEHDVGRLGRAQRREQGGDVRVFLGHARYCGTPRPFSWRY